MEGASGAPYVTEQSARSERDERPKRPSGAPGASETSARSDAAKRPERRSGAAEARKRSGRSHGGERLGRPLPNGSVLDATFGNLPGPV